MDENPRESESPDDEQYGEQKDAVGASTEESTGAKVVNLKPGQSKKKALKLRKKC